MLTARRLSRFHRVVLAMAGCLALVVGPSAPGVAARPKLGGIRPFPDVITLPPGFAPEGIAVGRGTTFYVGSLGDGSIARGDLRTGTVAVIAPPFGPFSTVGVEVDARNRVWVAGGVSGTGRVYDGATGALLASYDFTAAFDSFVNDVLVTPTAAWFTDSGTRLPTGFGAGEPRLFVVPLGNAGALPDQSAVRTVGVDVPDLGFPNLNGIEWFGGRLLVGHTTDESLYWVDPASGDATRIDVGRALPANDGIVRRGATVYVVQNSLAQISAVKLGTGDEATVTDVYSVTGADTPTTAALFGASIYAVDARFNLGTDPYRVFRVALH